MRYLSTLAAASALFFLVSSTAVAAPIIVTYGIAPGGTATYAPSANGSPGSGNNGGQMIIVYTSGSPTLGGTLGGNGQMQILQISLATPATILGPGNQIPGLGVGAGAVGTRTPGGVGNFAGPTAIPVGAFGPGQPPVAINGNVAGINFAPIGAVTILINGAGTQVFSGLPQIWNWTVGSLVGAEISRTVVPEPGSGFLLLGGLAGLAFTARRRLRS
jgi:hypothetical protein